MRTAYVVVGGVVAWLTLLTVVAVVVVVVARNRSVATPCGTNEERNGAGVCACKTGYVRGGGGAGSACVVAACPSPTRASLDSNLTQTALRNALAAWLTRWRSDAAPWSVTRIATIGAIIRGLRTTAYVATEHEMFALCDLSDDGCPLASGVSVGFFSCDGKRPYPPVVTTSGRPQSSCPLVGDDGALYDAIKHEARPDEIRTLRKLEFPMVRVVFDATSGADTVLDYVVYVPLTATGCFDFDALRQIPGPRRPPSDRCAPGRRR
jgi:hypothetical protein